MEDQVIPDWRSKLKRYEVHVVVEKVKIKPKISVGIDLGLKRLVA